MERKVYILIIYYSTNKMNNKNEQSIRTYLPPLYARLTKSYAAYTGMSESGVVAAIIKKNFDNMPIQERDRILQTEKKQGRL